MNRLALALALAAAAAVVLLTACGPREAGITEADHGSIFYWAVTGSSIDFGEECTDDEDFRATSAPQFEENSYIMYRVSDDGTQAITQDCTTTDASSCTDDPNGFIFDIDGNTYVYDPAPELEDIANSACDLENDQLWTLTDQREPLTANISLTFNLVGDAAVCDGVEAQLESESGNNQGFDGCVVSLNVDTEFDSSQMP